MSLIICVHVEEGIVLASDSKITYNKTKDGVRYMGVHTTNTANKTFVCPNNCGISTCGDACVKGKPISGYIEAFIRENVKVDTSVEDIPYLIKSYFKNLETSLNTTFIIAGYKKEEGKYIQKIYRMNTLSDNVETIETCSQGALWDGETITLTKLLTPVYAKNKDRYISLPVPEFAWNFYTLQDAIDFAKYGIKTTIDTMRFQTIPETVGEPIDILIIKPEETEWISKKELRG